VGGTQETKRTGKEGDKMKREEEKWKKEVSLPQ